MTGAVMGEMAGGVSAQVQGLREDRRMCEPAPVNQHEDEAQR